MTTRLNIILLVIASLLIGCKGINRDPYTDTPTTGIINIGVDETFKTIAEAELMVFEELYLYAEITPIYKTESECVQLLLDDSVRLIVIYRPLFADEKASFESKKIIPRQMKIASDAVAVIVHPDNNDTVLSMSSLKSILTGGIKQWKQINENSTLGNIDLIFDNKNSSILQFVIDSVCVGTRLSEQSFAMDSTVDVVNYVSNHPNAIGFIGVSLVSDTDDSAQMSFLNRIHVVALSESETATADNSYKPFQAYIYKGFYPLIRDVYVIDAEPRNGLATGFMSFLASDKGQRIMLKSGIVPAAAPIRLVNVRESI